MAQAEKLIYFYRIAYYLAAFFHAVFFASFQKFCEMRRADAIDCGKRISIPVGFDQKEVAS
jgi:hypothetical protein